GRRLGIYIPGKARQRTAAGTLRYTSQYLPMSDGTRLAIDIALPKVLKPGDKIPALIKGTPYWRASRLTFLGGALAELGLLRGLPNEPDVALLNDRGYAVITGVSCIGFALSLNSWTDCRLCFGSGAYVSESADRCPDSGTRATSLVSPHFAQQTGVRSKGPPPLEGQPADR